MKRTHPALWGFGWAGLFVGLLLALLGMTDTGEVARLSGGYGLMMAGAAVYLLGGLAIRRAIAHRAMLDRARVPATPRSNTRPAATQPQVQA